jgi:hypothetical protein
MDIVMDIVNKIWIIIPLETSFEYEYDVIIFVIYNSYFGENIYDLFFLKCVLP